MSKQTAIQQMISEFEEIKKTKCKTLQELMFFDGVLAIIEAKYLEMEKQNIIDAYSSALGRAISGNIQDRADDYYTKTFGK